MKTIGLLGGMTSESTASYYRIINRRINERLGGEHSAKLLLYSVDFAEVEALQVTDRWEEAGHLLGEAAARLEGAGADFLVLCTNTMHKVAPLIEAQVKIPLLHIVDITAEAIRRQGCQMVGLLGTSFTMEQDFYRKRLETRHGLEVLTPSAGDREFVHRVICEELAFGKFTDASREGFLHIIQDLAQRGVQGVILGCTEIPLLVSQRDTAIPLFDTTELHALAAAEFALNE